MFYIYGLFEIITNIVFINFFVISVSFFIIPEGVLNAHSLYFNEIFHLLQECIKFISFIFTKFKNIRQCQCGKCGFVSVFRESDFAFLSYMKSLEEKQIYERQVRKIDIVKEII